MARSRDLKKICEQRITIDEEEWRWSKSVLEQFKSSLIPAMKRKNLLFNELFKEFYYSGSSYIGLKISEPNEFDLNLCLNFPFKPRDYEIFLSDIKPSFAVCSLNRPFDELVTPYHPKYESLKQMRKWFDEPHGMVLRINPVLRWIQGIIDAVLESQDLLYGFEIRRKNSGPAITLILRNEFTGKQVDVDLVPVFKFRKSEKWPDSYKVEDICERFPRILEVHKFFFLVPKPEKNTSGQDAWRIDYPEIEKQLIHNQGCLKFVMKMLKLLRDCQDWKGIASYHIKTVMMWEYLKNPESDFWTEKNLDNRFMEALIALSERLEVCNIPFLFNEKANLLKARVARDTASNISFRIKQISRKICYDPSCVDSFFIPINERYPMLLNSNVEEEQKQQQWSCTMM